MKGTSHEWRVNVFQRISLGYPFRMDIKVEVKQEEHLLEAPVEGVDPPTNGGPIVPIIEEDPGYDKPQCVYESDLPGGWYKKIIQRGKPKNEKNKGSSRATDAYIFSPAKKRLRSSYELLVYIVDHPEFWDDFDPYVVNLENPKKDPNSFTFGTKKIIKFFEDIKNGVDVEIAKASATDHVKQSRSVKAAIKKNPMQTLPSDFTMTSTDFANVLNFDRPSMIPFDRPSLTPIPSVTPLLSPLLQNPNMLGKLPLPPLRPLFPGQAGPLPLPNFPPPILDNDDPVITQVPERDSLTDREDVIQKFEKYFVKKGDLPTSTQMIAWSKQHNVNYGDVARWFLKRWKSRLFQAEGQASPSQDPPPAKKQKIMSVPQDELAAGDDFDDEDDYDPTAFLQTEFVEGDTSIGETEKLDSDVQGTEENTSNHKDSQDNNNGIGATTAQNNDDDDVEVKAEPLEFVECS